MPCAEPLRRRRNEMGCFHWETVAGMAGMVGCFNPKTKGWTNTKSCSGFLAGKACRW